MRQFYVKTDYKVVCNNCMCITSWNILSTLGNLVSKFMKDLRYSTFRVLQTYLTKRERNCWDSRICKERESSIIQRKFLAVRKARICFSESFLKNKTVLPCNLTLPPNKVLIWISLGIGKLTARLCLNLYLTQ